MKTTLMVPAALYRRLKRRAAAEHRSTSDLLVELLQAGLMAAPAHDTRLPRLPVFDLGRARVSVADREALEHAMRPHD